MFQHLDQILDVSQKKFNRTTVSESKRLKWGRLSIAAVQAYGKILETAALQDFEQRINALEERRLKEEG